MKIQKILTSKFDVDWPVVRSSGKVYCLEYSLIGLGQRINYL